MEKYFDLAVIGAGPGGYAAAVKAARNGLRTALVEKELLGGVCLNYGCIPTKTVLHAVKLYQNVKNSEKYGITAEHPAISMQKVFEKKDEIVETLRTGMVSVLEGLEVEVFYDEASVSAGKDRHRIDLKKSGSCLYAENVIMATGARPYIPNIPGIDSAGVMTAKEMLCRPVEKLKRLVIIGGGVIGAEFAYIYGGTGCEVTVVEKEKRMVASMDESISRSIKTILKKQGVKILTSAQVTEIKVPEKISGKENRSEETKLSGKESVAEKTEASGRDEVSGRLSVYVTSGTGKIQTLAADVVLVAVGNRPSDPSQAYIATDDHFQTEIPGIYAIGDATGGLQLAHVAAAQAELATENILGKKTGSESRNNRQDKIMKAIPVCIYTSPEAASVGYTEAEAKKQGMDVYTRQYTMSGNGMSVLTDSSRGFIKIVADKKTHQLVGAQMVCNDASNLISEFTQAVISGLTTEEMGSMIRPHPTYSEAISEMLGRNL